MLYFRSFVALCDTSYRISVCTEGEEFHAEDTEGHGEARREHRNFSAPHQFLRVLRVMLFRRPLLHSGLIKMV